MIDWVVVYFYAFFLFSIDFIMMRWEFEHVPMFCLHARLFNLWFLFYFLVFLKSVGFVCLLVSFSRRMELFIL